MVVPDVYGQREDVVVEFPILTKDTAWYGFPSDGLNPVVTEVWRDWDLRQVRFLVAIAKAYTLVVLWV